MVSQKTGDIRYCWQKMVAVVLMKLMVCWVARRKDTDKIIGVVFIVQQQLRGNKEHTLNGTCLSMTRLFAVEFRCLLVVCRHGNVVSELRKRTANCSWKIKRIVRWLTVDGTEIGKREREMDCSSWLMRQEVKRVEKGKVSIGQRRDTAWERSV